MANHVAGPLCEPELTQVLDMVCHCHHNSIGGGLAQVGQPESLSHRDQLGRMRADHAFIGDG